MQATMAESKLSTEKAPQHLEEARLSLNQQDPFDYDKLHYGNTGLKGLASSPYVFGAAFLASMGGFSFGYGAQLLLLMGCAWLLN